MNTYDPISAKTRLVLAAATLAIAMGALELVVGAMKFPDPEKVAFRERVITAQSERAQHIRELQKSELRTVTPAPGGRVYAGLE